MKKIVYTFLFFSLLFSCSEDEESVVNLNDSFDREAMLTNWANNIILPRYEAYRGAVENLVNAKNTFVTAPNGSSYEQLDAAWLSAYTAWQWVSMFEIGKAEEITLRDFINTFPTNANNIEANIQSANYNLALPSARSQQGFPALDYLLHGRSGTTAEAVATFAQSENHRQYLSDVVDRISVLSNEVVNDWQNGYRESFITNSGSAASSSVNKLVNDFMFYYEKALRAGKIGIPAGVFSNQPLSDRVEGLYKEEISKVLFQTALNASADFFVGNHFNGNGRGVSLKDYLNFVEASTEGEPLSALIENQFNVAKQKGNLLRDNFRLEVETNNAKMLETYDALQANVILMKVDMFQALNVRVDYVDADGD